jgi:hypothetical protein
VPPVVGLRGIVTAAWYCWQVQDGCHPGMAAWWTGRAQTRMLRQAWTAAGVLPATTEHSTRLGPSSRRVPGRVLCGHLLSVATIHMCTWVADGLTLSRCWAIAIQSQRHCSGMWILQSHRW